MSSNEQLIIPKLCKAGFNVRTDTYSQRLAYVIYNDGKKWRKETSWEGWRQKEGESKGRTWNAKTRQYEEKYGEEVRVVEFENVPTSGFVLNKKVGGHSSGWNHRNTYCRVWDPRNWEFEISLENLLFILQETDSMKGKGLVGDFCYSYSGKDLVLLPCGSVDYQKSQNFTKLQTQKVSAKSLIPGAVYKTKREGDVTYIGRLDWVENSYDYRSDCIKYLPKKQHIFHCEGGFFPKSSVEFLAECIQESSADFAQLVEKYSLSRNASKIIDVEFLDLEEEDYPKKSSYDYYGYSNFNICLVRNDNIKVSVQSRRVYNNGKYEDMGWTIVDCKVYNFKDFTSTPIKSSRSNGYYYNYDNPDHRKYETLDELIRKEGVKKMNFLTENGGKIINNFF
jgi:hypothetical protein